MAANPNFEVLCNTGDPNCQQYTRNNSKAGYPWSSGTTTTISGGSPTHVSLILSAPWGNLEAVVVSPQGGLQHWWRNPNDPPGVWNLGAQLDKEAGVGDINAPPSLIQAVSYGETQIGNFELLVPDTFGNILHLTRNNNAANFPWSLRENLDSVAPPKPLRSFRVTMALPLGPASS